MSKIKTNQLQHTANGAAVYTLPTTDGSAGQVLQTNGSGVLSWVSLPSGGLAMADQFRITGNGTLNTDATSQLNSSISCTWERADSDSAGFIGTGMTQSDGVYTFPSTGIYQIIGNLVVSRDAAENRYANFNLEVSTDGGSSYDIAAIGSGGFGQVYQRDTCSLCFILDVTSTTNVKVRFSASTNRSNVQFRGDTGANYSAVIFTKLGET
tara:strand:- start:124 stop:753 length:630 start_codon:yes stop_codon:yes gene_type:complete